MDKATSFAAPTFQHLRGTLDQLIDAPVLEVTLFQNEVTVVPLEVVRDTDYFTLDMRIVCPG